MNNIHKYNHKYNNITSLLTVNGNINTALVRRDWFKQLDIYKQILEKSIELDIFENVTFADRFFFVLNDLKLQNCPICGKPMIYFKKSQNSYRFCKHKTNLDVNKVKTIHKKLHKNKHLMFENYVKTCPATILNRQDFFNLLHKYFNSRPNNNFLITSENMDFFHDVVLQTKNILPFLSYSDFKMSERLYILFNNITEIPKCLYCEKNVSFYNRLKGFSKTCKKHFNLLACKNRINNNLEKLHTYINKDKYEILKLPSKISNDTLVIKCKVCGKTSEWLINNGLLNKLPTMLLCNFCENSGSKQENEVYLFLKNFYKKEIKHKIGTRVIIPPKELDIYIPEKKLAIEFDGLYWHSVTEKSDKNYHLNKTLACEKHGIQLIHIFENEWKLKQDIVKCRLKNLLGIYDKTIYARKCEIKEVDSKLSKEFQEENHIQGAVNSKVNLGLYFEDELVSLMTFGKCRFDKTHEWELLRFCNRLGYHIPGGASKLLKHFERTYNPKSLVSYADRRWSQGKVYEKLGFTFSHASQPNYWYWKSMILESRVKYQKHKLKNLLEKFDETKTEVENMKANGYNRIFDCGNLVYEKKY